MPNDEESPHFKPLATITHSWPSAASSMSLSSELADRPHKGRIVRIVRGSSATCDAPGTTWLKGETS